MTMRGSKFHPSPELRLVMADIKIFQKTQCSESARRLNQLRNLFGESFVRACSVLSADGGVEAAERAAGYPARSFRAIVDVTSRSIAEIYSDPVIGESK